jgi:hypothetical protein
MSELIREIVTYVVTEPVPIVVCGPSAGGRNKEDISALTRRWPPYEEPMFLLSGFCFLDPIK